MLKSIIIILLILMLLLAVLNGLKKADARILIISIPLFSILFSLLSNSTECLLFTLGLMANFFIAYLIAYGPYLYNKNKNKKQISSNKKD